VHRGHLEGVATLPHNTLTNKSELFKEFQKLPPIKQEQFAKVYQTYALFELADALRRLGNNNATTEMGAIEGLSCAIRDGFADLARLP
jgi:hypothetical protein